MGAYKRKPLEEHTDEELRAFIKTKGYDCAKTSREDLLQIATLLVSYLGGDYPESGPVSRLRKK